MKRGRPARCFLKWAGTLLGGACAAALIVSIWYTVAYIRYSSWPPAGAAIRNGMLIVVIPSDAFNEKPPARWIVTITEPDPFLGNFFWPRVVSDKNAVRSLLTVPLWLVLLIVLLPTLLLWRLDRRRPPPGHCRRCGYDLTGNTTGRCPECGCILTDFNA